MNSDTETFLFCAAKAEPESDGVYSAVIGQVDSKNQLMKEIAKVLKFPSYFGENWDALHECLRDFNWVMEKKIILSHDQIPKLTVPDKRIYFEILVDSMEFWKHESEHQFKVIFPISDRWEILKIYPPAVS